MPVDVSTPRVLNQCDRLVDYSEGGLGLANARALGAEAVIAQVDASGLRGRGGAGFPTGRKWRAVGANRSPVEPTTVVVNAAEGEPGAFKDRAIMRANPYRVLEGALIAALSVRADRVVVATKGSFQKEVARLRAAVDEIRDAGWTEGVSLEVFAGPDEYLYGEETALLEAVDGRAPFPRIAPPFRHGVEEIGDGSVDAAPVVMAAPDLSSPAPPTLVNNVETFAHVACILARGPDWFREVGTSESPGTTVCTVTGAVRHEGVAEVPMGTPLRDVIDRVGGGARDDRRVVAVLSGVAHPLLPAALLDTPVSFEGLDAAGAGLGAAGFIVFDDEDDLVAAVAGVSRFLAVESCGQCTPCKQDGLAIAGHLAALCRGEAADHDIANIADRASTVANGARCYLAQQHQRVVDSLLRLFPDAARAHLALEPVEPILIAPIVDIVDGVAILDEHHAAKQPDWTFDRIDSGQAPADRLHP